MSNRSYRIALESLRSEVRGSTPSLNEAKKVVLEGLDLIKSRKIRDINSFILYLEESNVDQKQFADVITKIIESEEAEEILSLGEHLGEKGINLLRSSWWKRNLPDSVLKKIIAPKWWDYFRDNMWLNQHRVLN